MLRAIIVDDEQSGIDTLKMLIDRYTPQLQVVSESNKAPDALTLIGNYHPDIVFLDINMPQMDGFQLLDNLAWREFNLVFTTAHPEYGLRALKNNAIDYLLKPIDPKDLASAVARIEKQMRDNREQNQRYNIEGLLKGLQRKNHLVLPTKNGVEHIVLSDIVCLESTSNYTTLYLSDGRSITSSRHLKEFDNQLCSHSAEFMRVHNSYIVNLARVARCLKLSDKIVMDNQQEVPLSKSRKETFFKWMGLHRS